MCVICVKPKGVDMPPNSWIENMWYSNHDGAGFMYNNGKKVVIEKGFMKLADFKDALVRLRDKVNVKDIALIMHFRIGTAGGNVPANTHPFPISDSIPVLQKLICNTSLGIVHNGIIPIKPSLENISDTMEYIASVLAPIYRYDNEFYRSKDMLQAIGNQTTSKWAFMTPAGEVFTIGNFIEESGLLFSNTSYSSGYWWRRMPTKYYGVDDDDDIDIDWSYGFSHGEYCIDLMALKTGDYVIDMQSGAFLDADDYTFFVDAAGFLYVYSDEDQCCFSISGDYAVYDKDGREIIWDRNKAFAMLVQDDDINLTDIYFYDDDGDEEPKDDAKKDADNKDMPF